MPQNQLAATPDSPPSTVDLLREAVDLIENANQVETDAWTTKALAWHKRWVALLPYLDRGRAADIEILERASQESIDSIDQSHGVIVPTEIRVNGVPLLITEEGPVIQKIATGGPDGRGPVMVTMTVFARRVLIDARATEARA